LNFVGVAILKRDTRTDEIASMLAAELMCSSINFANA
jgi:hypothetical protein